jgi:hypothetical protein
MIRSMMAERVMNGPYRRWDLSIWGIGFLYPYKFAFNPGFWCNLSGIGIPGIFPEIGGDLSRGLDDRLPSPR